MIRTLTSLALALLILVPVSAHAEDGPFSANVALTTDYVFRGISQSDEGPAVQGGFDYAHDSGIYLGVWGSSIDLPQAETEIDFYGGINGAIDKFTWDVGGIYYYYPGDNSDYDFWEAALSIGYDFDLFAISLGLNYSPEFFADSGKAFYYAAYLDIPLPHDFSLSGHVGRQTIDNRIAFGSPSYTDWAVGLGYTLEGFDLGLTYSDTSLDEPTECVDGCDAKVVFSVSRSF